MDFVLIFIFFNLLSLIFQREVPNADNTTTVVFNQSVPMSTYLVCFIVSDLVSKQMPIKANGIGHDFHMKVYARPSEIDKVDFALNAGVKAIEFFIQYFQKEYPLPKLGTIFFFFCNYQFD